MSMIPVRCAFDERPRRIRRTHADPCQPGWSSRLPPAWRGRVVAPCRFKVYREFEIPARRVLGFDTRGEICFRAHDYRLLDACSDDDEDFYGVLTYAESVVAWRLKEQGWLLYRRVESQVDDEGREDGFSLVDEQRALTL